MGVRCRILGIMLGCSVYVGYLVKLFLFVFILGVMKSYVKAAFLNTKWTKTPSKS